MLKSYLPRAFQYYALIVLALLFVTGHVTSFVIFLSLFLFLNFVYRKRIFNIDEYIDIRGFKESVLCPISGYVTKVFTPFVGPYAKNYVCIEITSNINFETGLFLPIKSEVKEFVLETREGTFKLGFLDYNLLKEHKIKSLSIVFSDKYKNEISLEFPKRVFLPWPRVWMMPGDRGRIGVNMGHLPFGGKVSLYLPKNYEILVTNGDKVKAAATLIAAVKEISEVS